MTLFVMGLILPRVDNAAHAGGFVGGYLAGIWLDPLKPERVDHLRRRCRLPRGDRPRDHRVDCDVPAEGEQLVPPVLSRFQREYRSTIRSIARRQTRQKPTGSRREHDAVGLRPVEPLRLVRRPLRTPRPLPSARMRRQELRVPVAVCSRNSASISDSGALRARISRRRFWMSRGVCLELRPFPTASASACRA